MKHKLNRENIKGICRILALNSYDISDYDLAITKIEVLMVVYSMRQEVIDAFIPPPSRIPRSLAAGMKGVFESFPRSPILRGKVGGFIKEINRQLSIIMQREPELINKLSPIGLLLSYFKVVKKDRDLSRKRYVLISKKRMRDELMDVIEETRRYNIEFVEELPSDVDMRDMVVLVDPQDIGEWKDKHLLYLPLPYMRISFYLAAELALSEKEDLRNTNAVRFLWGFYERLVNEELSETQVMDLFNRPWWIEGKIRLLNKDLEILSEAIRELEKFV